MNAQLNQLREQSQLMESICSPQFFRLSIANDQHALRRLLTEHQTITVHDELLGQLEELVKCQNPKVKYTKESLRAAAEAYVGSIPFEEYGVWVYYPWSNKLVHVLDEQEFVYVRTNRNQYKITPQEEDVLATKKIGVIGLSVGKAIAMTIAMERICGEIRIADFDVIELSNLNRIQTGVQNFGIKKTVVVAREIAEIDPYLNVTIYSEGLTEDNVDDFFLKNGKLDICIEVCDGLYTKIFARQKAKAFGIPVVMNSSDRGTTDIERYDLNSTLPILHGLIDHLDLNLVKQAKTNEEKVPYLLAMLGLDTSSTRLKASMLEIEETITTWPQLASGVVLGGGICADVCRRMLLGELKDSGRYFVDFEKLIHDKNEPVNTKQERFVLRPSLQDTEMVDIIKERNDSIIKGQIKLDQKLVNEIVTSATLAPTGANIQPWKWVYYESSLYLFFDDRYSAGLLDYGNTTSFVGLGAATENLVLKAHELGLEVVAEKQALNKNSKLICVYKFFKERDSEIEDIVEPHICDELVTTIPQRVTNRNIGKRIHIEKDRLEKIREIARTVPGADLKLIYDEKILDEIKDVTAVMDRIRVTHKGGHKDFLAEIRWTPEEARLYSNGVDLLGTVDLTPTELAGWQVIKDWDVIQHLNDWNLGRATEKIQRKSITASSAVGLLTMPKFDCNNFYEGGRAFQRIWLQANQDNICVHPASLSTLIFNTFNYGDKSSFPERMRNEIAEMRKKFENLFSIKEPLGEVILFRFFIGDAPKSKSVRYPIDQVLKFI